MSDRAYALIADGIRGRLCAIIDEIEEGRHAEALELAKELEEDVHESVPVAERLQCAEEGEDDA